MCMSISLPQITSKVMKRVKSNLSLTLQMHLRQMLMPGVNYNPCYKLNIWVPNLNRALIETSVI